jgi:signal transduction histidine kinase
MDERISAAMKTFRNNRRRVIKENNLLPDFTSMLEVTDLVADSSMLDGVDMTPEQLIAGLDQAYFAERKRAAMTERWALNALATAMTGHEINSQLGTLGSIVSSAATRNPDDQQLQYAKSVVEKFRDNMHFANRFAENAYRSTRPPSACLKAVEKEFSQAIGNGWLTIEVTPAFEAVEYFSNDLVLEVVLNNLIRNSYYWASQDDKKVIVRLDAETRSYVDSEGDTQTDTVLRIEDNGPGIPEGKRQKVFEPGYSGRNSTGIGLYLCRANLEQNYSAIQVSDRRSDLGGAVFLIGYKRVLEPPITTHSEIEAQTVAMESLAVMLEDGHVAELDKYGDVFATASAAVMRLRIRGLETENEKRLAAAVDRINEFMKTYEPQAPSPGL